MRSQVGTGELVARLFLAVLLALVSGGLLVYVFAFCTLVGGGFRTAERRGGGPFWARCTCPPTRVS